MYVGKWEEYLQRKKGETHQKGLLVDDDDETDDDSIADGPPADTPPRQLALRQLQPQKGPKDGVRLCKLAPPKKTKSKALQVHDKHNDPKEAEPIQI